MTTPTTPDHPPDCADFVPLTVLKRDMFSETWLGHAPGDPQDKRVLRRLDTVPWYARPISRALARREVRGLAAVSGIQGCPTLIRADAQGLLRDWAAGTPLQLARPSDRTWYDDARRILRDMRRRGVTHNDIAKPQNWLMTPDGRAAVIDFQLASVHRRRGLLFRLMAREDLRHLLKQKRNFARHLLTPSEWRMLHHKALPTRIWLATGKRLYKFITRRLMHWSDSEGDENRIAQEGPAIRKALQAQPGIGAVTLCPFSQPGRTVGIYAFVETTRDASAIEADLAAATRPDLLQTVARLPRDTEGQVRADLLHLVAGNRLDELTQLMDGDPDLSALMQPIIAARRNLTDRVLRK
ncbi:MAG: serine/threonine protein kinase [Sediminimonas qiaohouensis]|uniref:Serine/threonine protein kinase n=1 Tax=Sediminimonas qiaohouensis TaxID=552061 RepID=A0A7C9HBK8_9RHOB|nr:serine/threonine protein kinase [Sediminimonas qiaohouensis]MTJ05346.1 serine/threonine protein kinase [Sediminimonas qiaohouensis]